MKFKHHRKRKHYIYICKKVLPMRVTNYMKLQESEKIQVINFYHITNSYNNGKKEC